MTTKPGAHDNLVGWVRIDANPRLKRDQEPNPEVTHEG